MTMTPESKVKQALKKRLKQLPPSDIWFYFAQDRFTSGVPDVIGVTRGVFFAVELKAPGEKPRALQGVVMKAIACAGGVVGHADNVDDALAIVELARCKSFGIQQNRK